MKLAAVAAYGALTDIYAVSDLDSQIANGGWQNEAAAPVHGNTRNSLYFDWHVKAFKGTNLNAHHPVMPSFVAQAFQPAGSRDFLVPCSRFS